MNTHNILKLEIEKQILMYSALLDSKSTQALSRLSDEKIQFIQKRLSALSVYYTQLDSSENITAVFMARNKPLAVERLIVGNGVTGTTLFSLLPEDYRQPLSETNPAPKTLVIADPNAPQQWCFYMGTDALMGQGPRLQHSKIDSTKHISPDQLQGKLHTKNPFNYTKGEDFNLSLVTYQNDLNMQNVLAKMQKIESQSEVADWPSEFSQYPYRVNILVYGEEKTVYTQHVDLCTGFGAARQLSSNVIDPQTASELIKERKMLFGQEHVQPAVSGKVAIYGGGAIGVKVAKSLKEATEKADTEMETFQWIARRKADFHPQGLGKNRLFTKFVSHEDNVKAYLGVGDLIRVEKQPNGKILLRFNKGDLNNNEREAPLKGIKEYADNETLEVDYLILTIGQDIKLDFLPKVEFQPVYGAIPTINTTMYPLGTQSADNRITFWGPPGKCSGLGLNPKNNDHKLILDQFHQMNARQAATVPHEGKIGTILLTISWAVPQMAHVLALRSHFPIHPNNDAAFRDYLNINSETQEQLTSQIKGICKRFMQASSEAENVIDNKIVHCILDSRLATTGGLTADGLLNSLHEYITPEKVPALQEALPEEELPDFHRGIVQFYFGQLTQEHHIVTPIINQSKSLTFIND